MRRAIGRLLVLLDYKATFVESAEKALEHLEGGHIDVVISDIRMPGLSGLDLLKLMRQRHYAVPVILVSATTDAHSAAEAVALGAFHQFNKPINFEDFQVSLAAAVDKRRRRTPAQPMPKALAPQLRSTIDQLSVTHRPICGASGERIGYDAVVAGKSSTISGHRIAAAAAQLDMLPQLGARYCELALSALRGGDELVFLDVDDANLIGPGAVRPATLQRQEHRIALQLDLDQAQTALLPGEPMDKLRRAGASVSLATSTNGRSVIAKVKALRPDFLRLTDDLVRRVLDSSGHQRLVGSMIRMCVASGATVIAAGIRDVNELTVLHSLGCELFVGSYIGPPSVLPAGEAAPEKAHAS